MTGRNATLAGLAAIVLWSTMVGMIRLVTESLGAIGGAAMIYTCCSVLLFLTVGWPKLREFNRVYLLTGALMFAGYEVCFALAIGLATDARQAIEVGIVNYLWPCLTVLFAILFTGQRSSILFIPGIGLSIAGIALVLGGDTGLDLPGTIENIRTNPLSYALALLGAVIWSAYCTVTKLFAKGNNGITPFFMLTAASFWVLYLFSDTEPIHLTLTGVVATMVAACAIGFGYALWNVGILHGNMTLLAAASYFTPVLSAAFSSLMLATALGVTFWVGTAIVCVGATVCWVATREPKKAGETTPPAAATPDSTATDERPRDRAAVRVSGRRHSSRGPSALGIRRRKHEAGAIDTH
ncbi:aromatic amino acid DMT transporter YddG [Rhodococcus wratislaviensis]|nr:aromatic amino acid DMT transporter YddG [Rhodococcus wratislaviensis]